MTVEQRWYHYLWNMLKMGPGFAFIVFVFLHWVLLQLALPHGFPTLLLVVNWLPHIGNYSSAFTCFFSASICRSSDSSNGLPWTLFSLQEVSVCGSCDNFNGLSWTLSSFQEVSVCRSSDNYTSFYIKNCIMGYQLLRFNFTDLSWTPLSSPR